MPVISRVLIAGGSAEQSVSSGHVAAKCIVGGRGAKGNLDGCLADVAKMEEALLVADRRIGLQTRSRAFKSTGANTPVSPVREAIQAAIADPDAAWVELYYSGHGTTLNGDWCFEDSRGRTTDYITLDDILSLWQAAQAQGLDKRMLYINSDACFSGAWVQAVKSRGVGSVTVRASCGPLEVSWDTPSGGVFTKAMLKCMKGHHHPSRDRVGSLFAGCSLEGTDEPQTPCWHQT